VWIDGSDSQQTIKNCRRGAAIAGLHDKIARRLIFQNRGIVRCMDAVNHIEGSVARQLERGASLCLFEKSRFAEHGAELLWPLVTGDFSGERLEARAVTAGQNDCPFAFSITYHAPQR
jgi:hypothetical protein